ncbi:non-canonical purine NTP phosphatase [Maribellus comscasis]|uniref:Probable inosine/xanthosine triphosphatase n=1 Tax=Maribellus comscasis TaxID=2681766 RepID=A0A6I6JKS1_9BACT|nr:inosine/xanthosine triphosphatase [Maribellus comscasis]QGY43396.1 non-canonical purine NTP phosphatase [Maribellus comscasis]
MRLNEKKIKIVVASENPVKISAVKEGFLDFYSTVEVESVEVDSGVSDQPVSDVETKLGAHNRAVGAKHKIPDANFWVGIEGGIEHSEKRTTAFAWIVVLSKDNSGEARTTTFLLPPAIADLVKSGRELGTAIDIIFNQENSKQKQGAVGLLTKNKISRTQLYVQAVQLSLIPFINTGLF